MTDLDEAFERFQAGDFEYAGGLSNHGPMAAEALVHLGHASLMRGFVDAYAPRLGPAPARGSPIPATERNAALGRPGRLADWLATYETELNQAPWSEVLQRSLPTLIDGLFAGGTHGLLRTAHAVRALEETETAQRRRELAHGLAYWAGRYQALPGNPGSQAREGWGPRRVLAEVRPVPPESRRQGFFTEGVLALDDDPNFAPLVASAEVSNSGWELLLSELCHDAAALYLENPQARVAYVHAVTAPSSLRLLGPYLDADQKRRSLGRALQVTAALHAIASGPRREAVDEEVRRLAEDPAEIRYRAACSLEEHAIKLSEACLREDREAPDPVFRLAAADAALKLGG